MRNLPALLIQKKRDGGELTADEIADFVSGVVDGSLGDAQLGAFLMAVCCRGMTRAETVALTLCMRDSGRVLRHEHVRAPKVDKHSTGGVGDKTSLLLAPLCAAAGLAVPMISGRGLGHTGGTIDKLEAIPGYRTGLSTEEFQSVLARGGYAMASAGPDIAPADRRMYAVRDISGTIESIPLITSSILSKKLSEGIDGLVMDVKCGRAAFMKRREDAVALAQGILAVGSAAGVRMCGLLTDMDVPLGRAIGNALEVAEIVDALHGRGPADMVDLTVELGAEMLLLGGIDTDLVAARARLRTHLADGSALRLFVRNLELQGGDPRIVDDLRRLGTAPVVVAVESPSDGFVHDVEPLSLGIATVELGGGRRQPTDRIDPLVGIVLGAHVGDAVVRGQPLATVHAATRAAAERALASVRGAFRIGAALRARGPVVLQRFA